MNDQLKLVAIKSVHTAIWVGFNVIIAYLFYAVLTGHTGLYFWMGIGAILLEAAILLAFQWSCPLTLVARRYSDSRRDNFDIFLPNWLARHNKTIYTVIFLILIGLYLFRLLRNDV